MRKAGQEADRGKARLVNADFNLDFAFAVRQAGQEAGRGKAWLVNANFSFNFAFGDGSAWGWQTSNKLAKANVFAFGCSQNYGKTRGFEPL